MNEGRVVEVRESSTTPLNFLFNRDKFLSFYSCFPLINDQPQLSIVLHYSYRRTWFPGWRESVSMNQ